MAVEVIKVYKEHIPSVRFIGKRYSDQDRDTVGSFAGKWNEWFTNSWFEEIGKLGVVAEAEGFSYGMMRMNGDQFEYWIGMLFPEQTQTPDGFSYADLSEGDAGICWLNGSADNGELYGIDPHNQCVSKITEQGWELKENPWFFERYHHSRFTSPDEKGNVILDYGMYVK